MKRSYQIAERKSTRKMKKVLLENSEALLLMVKLIVVKNWLKRSYSADFNRLNALYGIRQTSFTEKSYKRKKFPDSTSARGGQAHQRNQGLQEADDRSQIKKWLPKLDFRRRRPTVHRSPDASGVGVESYLDRCCRCWGHYHWAQASPLQRGPGPSSQGSGTPRSLSCLWKDVLASGRRSSI